MLNPIIWALLQELTPEHLIGRVVTFLQRRLHGVGDGGDDGLRGKGPMP